MAEHTPGLWTAEKCEHDPCWYVRNDTEVLAHVGTGLGMTRAMIAANAHLIAAAPDLLAALIQCRDQLVSIAQALGEYTQPSDVDAMNAADAAIAKARPQPSGV